jgi:hypothetical protein
MQVSASTLTSISIETLIEPSQRDLLFSYEDKRTGFKKFVHVIIAIFREIISDAKLALPFIKYFVLKWRKFEYSMLDLDSKYVTADLPWNKPEKNKPSEGLYVLLHGLNCPPCAWDNYITQIRKDQPDADCFVPVVKDAGNNSLESISKPILAAVGDYVKKNPGKPICLVGASNGARIAGYIERKLLQEKAAIKTISIAGVHFGTKIIDKLEEFRLLKLFNFHPNIVKDFKFGSESAKKYLFDWRQSDKLAEGIRDREFYASTEDDKVFTFTSGLPVINELKDKYIIIHGETHHSLIDAVQRRILQGCKNWMAAQAA